MPDFIIDNHGSIVLFTPLNAAAEAWLRDNVSNPIWWGRSVAVEPRFLESLAAGAVNYGFKVA